VCPGFMDGHMHIESSLLTPGEFENAVLPHGTTAIMADPHEIANVSGTAGLDYIMGLAKDLTMHVHFALPSCVPSNPLEESGAVLEADDLEPYYDREEVAALGEVMNAGGVVSGDDKLISKICDAERAGRVVDGHAPNLSGKALNTYVVAGVGSDHECTNAAEGKEKMRLGQWIMIREGTAAKNLEALIALCAPPYHQRAMFVTDDRHPEDLIQEGHMDNAVRKAIRLGADPVRAIKMCTWNPAQYFQLDHYGAVAPGYHADLVVLSDLEQVKVDQVYVNGELAAENGKTLKPAADPAPVSAEIWDSFHMQPVTPEQLAFPIKGDVLRVICLTKHDLLTEEKLIAVTDEDRANGGINLKKDIIKMAVFERHHNTGHRGIGFLHGYGLKAGAIATSVAHDAHNLIVAGTNDSDMAAAAERVRKMKGGLVVVCDGAVLAELPLPIAGLMCPYGCAEAAEKMEKMKEAAHSLGVSNDIDAFMTLGFVSLPVIPKLRLNGRGLINVDLQEVTPVYEFLKKQIDKGVERLKNKAGNQ
ncbi:MAG: adenine deaminase, partial [Anaerolineaceae bacterium]|nr:adenine deaminase [Anaerolineaceae bacterium]